MPSHHLILFKNNSCNASRVALVVKNPPANAGDIRDPGSIPGEGNGTLLQYSCLENPMDSGAWWAAVCRAAESQTRLKQLSTHAQGMKHVSCNTFSSILVFYFSLLSFFISSLFFFFFALLGLLYFLQLSRNRTFLKLWGNSVDAGPFFADINYKVWSIFRKSSRVSSQLSDSVHIHLFL